MKEDTKLVQKSKYLFKSNDHGNSSLFLADFEKVFTHWEWTVISRKLHFTFFGVYCYNFIKRNDTKIRVTWKVPSARKCWMLKMQSLRNNLIILCSIEKTYSVLEIFNFYIWNRSITFESEDAMIDISKRNRVYFFKYSETSE